MYRNGILDDAMYSLLIDWYNFVLCTNPIKIDHIGNKNNNYDHSEKKKKIFF